MHQQNSLHYHAEWYSQMFSSDVKKCCWFVVQEAIVIPPWIALAIRPRPGVWEYLRINVSQLGVEELSVPEYLQFKEQLVDGRYLEL